MKRKQVECLCGAVLVANIPFITKHYQGFKSAPCECGSLSGCESVVTRTKEEYESWVSTLQEGGL